MKLVQINTVGSGASPVAAIMNQIARAASASGHQSITVAGYGLDADATFVLEGQAGRCLNALRSRLYGNDGFAAHRATRRLVDFLEAERPDVVHLHNAHGYYLDLPGLVAWAERTATPLVVTLHDHWWLTGRCATPNAKGCHRWLEHNCGDCPSPSLYPAAWWHTRPHYKPEAWRGNIHFVMPSQHLADLAAMVGIHGTVIPNGIDRSVFNNSDNSYKDISLLAVANLWTPGKNLQGVVEANQACPTDLRGNCTVVGRGADKLRGEGITVYANTFSPADISRYYRRARILLSPSLSEAFGMTVAEALCCGTPVVVQRGTAPAELVGETDGVVVDFADRHALRSALERAASLTPTARRISDNSQMTTAYLQLYSSISH